MIRVGLTGSIGMGKSTTAKLFADEGVAVYDSDAAVHELYRGKAVADVGRIFPEAIIEGIVDRPALSKTLAKNPAMLSRLEQIIHPLVREQETRFLEEQRQAGAIIVLLDIPLLFETGANERVDVVVVVSCDADTQRQRVMARPGMTKEKFDMILSRQTPDAEKRARADFIVDTGHGISHARLQVREIIRSLRDFSGAYTNA